MQAFTKICTLLPFGIQMPARDLFANCSKIYATKQRNAPINDGEKVKRISAKYFMPHQSIEVTDND